MNKSERNFQALKRDASFPFRRYQHDDAEYMLAESYWTYLFKSVIGDNVDGAWHAWHSPDPEHAGNPIFSAVNPALERGTRVIQYPEEPASIRPGRKPGLFSFQPFLTSSPLNLSDYDNPKGMILELCIAAEISEESESHCREFWKWFCVELLPAAEVEQRIRKYELSVEPT